LVRKLHEQVRHGILNLHDVITCTGTGQSSTRCGSRDQRPPDATVRVGGSSRPTIIAAECRKCPCPVTYRPRYCGGTDSVSHTPLALTKNGKPSPAIRPASILRMTGLPRRCPTLAAVASSDERCT